MTVLSTCGIVAACGHDLVPSLGFQGPRTGGKKNLFFLFYHRMLGKTFPGTTLFLALFFFPGFLLADNPYFHKEMSFKELWKLYRFAYQQKNYKAHYDRLNKNRIFNSHGTIIGFRYSSRDGQILSVALRDRPCGYSIILWAPKKDLGPVAQMLEGLKVGDEIEFAGEFLETYRSDHLRVVMMPRMVRLRPDLKVRHFRDSFD